MLEVISEKYLLLSTQKDIVGSLVDSANQNLLVNQQELLCELVKITQSRKTHSQLHQIPSSWDRSPGIGISRLKSIEMNTLHFQLSSIVKLALESLEKTEVACLADQREIIFSITDRTNNLIKKVSHHLTLVGDTDKYNHIVSLNTNAEDFQHSKSSLKIYVNDIELDISDHSHPNCYHVYYDSKSYGYPETFLSVPVHFQNSYCTLLITYEIKYQTLPHFLPLNYKLKLPCEMLEHFFILQESAKHLFEIIGDTFCPLQNIRNQNPKSVPLDNSITLFKIHNWELEGAGYCLTVLQKKLL